MVAADRGLVWRGEGGRGKTPPLPAEARGRVLALDVSRASVVALTDTREVWRCSPATYWKWVWRSELLLGGDMNRDARERLLLGGFQRGSGGAWNVWAVTGRRTLVVGGSNFRVAAEIGSGLPIPGDEPILGVMLEGSGARVVVADGTLWRCSPSGWARDGNVSDPEPTLTCRVLVPFSAVVGGSTRDLKHGQVVRLSETIASREVLTGRVERVYVEEDEA